MFDGESQSSPLCNQDSGMFGCIKWSMCCAWRLLQRRYVLIVCEEDLHPLLFSLDSCQMDETCAMSQNDNSNEERLEQPRVMLV